MRKVITTALDKILLDADTDGAVQYVKDTISELLQNKLDMSLLVITKVSECYTCGGSPKACYGACAGVGISRMECGTRVGSYLQ